MLIKLYIYVIHDIATYFCINLETSPIPLSIFCCVVYIINVYV